MSVIKTTKGYQIRWYDVNGMSRKGTFHGIDRREAECLEREKCAERDRGERPVDENDAPTLRSFAEVWMQEARGQKGPWKASTKMQYRNALNAHLLPTFGDVRVSYIRENDVTAWLAGLEAKHLSPRRINLLLTTLKTLLKRARRCELVKKDYLEGVHLVEEPDVDVDPLGPDEVAAFLAACPRWWTPYFTVAFYTGIRPNEAAALRLSDVDWMHNTFRISKGIYRWVEGSPKTKASTRDVDMLPPVIAAMKEQKAQQAALRLKLGQGAPEAGQDYVFTGTDGGRFNINFVRDRVWYRTLAAAKLRRRVMYQTRHSFASNGLAAGESPSWVAAMLGHKGLEILFKTYAKYVPNRTRHDGSAFVAKMEGEGHAPAHQGRQVAEQNA